MDERIIENIRTRKGRLLDSQDEVGSWDRYPEELRPEDWDHDRDGMPDAWEKTHGLNPEDSADRNRDADGNEYTNLEGYINSLMPNMVKVMTLD